MMISFLTWICNTILSGVLASLLASFLFWFFTFKKSGVKIVFPEKLVLQTETESDNSASNVPDSELKPEDSKTGDKCIEYTENESVRVKLINIGKRDLIDVDVIGRLSISDFGSNNSTMSTHFPVGTTDKIISIRGDRQRRKQKRMFIILRTLYLDDEAFREYSRPKYGAKINEKAKSRTLQIWDVMNQYRENSYIRIYVEGYDEFTGRRLIFQSPDYTIDDIVPGKYQSLSFERNYKKGFEKLAFSIVDNK